MESEQVWEGCKYGVEYGKMNENFQLRFLARTVLPCISEKHVHTEVGAWGLGRRHMGVKCLVQLDKYQL